MKNHSIKTATYVIQPGDTIKSISTLFQISPKELLEVNGNIPLIMKPTRTIQVPIHSNPTLHIVRPGETLQDLVIRFKLAPDELLSLNDDLLLSPGQIIRIRP